jgi:copper chaperone CopZ
MQTESLKVTGMTCGGCTSTVTHALKSIAGVSDVDVSLSTGIATVRYNELLTSPGQLKTAVTGAGYDVNAAGVAEKPKGKGCCCS